MKITDTPIVSRSISQRDAETLKLKEIQQKQMDLKAVKRPTDSFDQCKSAINDSYITDALRKVRESEVTHSESLTRINGSWLFNKTLDSKEN
jgi:hypothetical protein